MEKKVRADSIGQNDTSPLGAGTAGHSEDFAELELSTWLLLEKSQGRNKAVRAAFLARKLKAPERTIRKMIAHLVEVHDLPIGSHPAYGFFIIKDSMDRDLATRHLKSRGLKILKRLSKIQKVSIEQAARQLTMFNALD